MTATALRPETRSIVVDEVFHHAPDVIWKAITSGELIARWMMQPHGFAPVPGNRFTFKTTPAGAWDGTIHCQVLAVIPCERFAYAWKGGDAGNVGYGAPLDTIVTFTLTRVQTGTRLRLEHAGFVLPKNDTAYQTMGKGWIKCVQTLGKVAETPEGDDPG